MQFIGKAAGCYADGLNATQWGLCCLFGAGCWVWQLFVVNPISHAAKPYIEARRLAREAANVKDERQGIKVIDGVEELIPTKLLQSARSISSSNLRGAKTKPTITPYSQ